MPRETDFWPFVITSAYSLYLELRPVSHLRLADEQNPAIPQRLAALERDVTVLKNDMVWVKEKLRSLDNRLWGIVAGVIITILLVLLK